MKICHTEAMKKIKELQDEKELILGREMENSYYSYKEGEERLPSSYNYSKTREDVKKIDLTIRKLKNALAIANTKIMIDEFNITIGEALVYLAQLQKERGQLEYLAAKKQKTRRITANGILEYTECDYDVNEVMNDIKEIRNTINSLQMAIDRANLNSYIEL